MRLLELGKPLPDMRDGKVEESARSYNFGGLQGSAGRCGVVPGLVWARDIVGVPCSSPLKGDENESSNLGESNGGSL